MIIAKMGVLILNNLKVLLQMISNVEIGLLFLVSSNKIKIMKNKEKMM
jgi:hypothetical protein